MLVQANPHVGKWGPGGSRITRTPTSQRHVVPIEKDGPQDAVEVARWGPRVRRAAGRGGPAVAERLRVASRAPGCFRDCCTPGVPAELTPEVEDYG